MNFRQIGVLIAVLASACGRSPVAPDPVFTLAVDRPAVTLARNASTQLDLLLVGPNQSVRSVATSATWASSAQNIVTVSAGGLVTAVGIGTAQVTGTFEGRSATATITARRNTRLAGEIAISEVGTDGVVDAATLSVDGRLIGSAPGSGSGPQRGARLRIHQLEPFLTRALVSPGAHELLLSVTLFYYPARTSATFVTDPNALLQIVDSDTGELVGTIPVPSQQATLAQGSAFRWSIQIGTFDR
jgi:hypothetical protein